MPKIELSEDVKAEIIEGWNQGASIEAMSRRHKTHTIKVANVIKERFGGVLPKRKRKSRIFTPEEEFEMVRMYQSGKHSAKEIYTRFKTSDDNLIGVLKKHGIDYVALNFAKVDHETEEKIVDMYQNQNMPSTKIYKTLDLPYQRVRKILLKHGLLDGKNKKIEEKYSQSVIQNVINEYQNKQVSVMDVSKTFGLSYSSVRNILLRNGVIIRTRKKLVRAPIPTKVDRSKEIIKHYLENGKVMRHTAKAVGVSPNVVTRILKAANLYESSRYTYNEDYFRNIDTHEKAYILGFLLTDGCNMESNGSISMTLHSQDKEILTQIMRKLSPDKELQKRVVGDTIHYCMQLNCLPMSRDLARHGIVQAKTFKIKVEDWMTGEFANSAILGMMDGDGSFYRRSRMGRGRLTPEESWTFSFIGMKAVCEMMKSLFKERLGINGSVSPHARYKNNIEKPLCTIRVYGNLQNKILMEWLYKDSPLYMKRKHDNYLDMLAFLKTKRINQFC